MGNSQLNQNDPTLISAAMQPSPKEDLTGRAIDEASCRQQPQPARWQVQLRLSLREPLTLREVTY